MLNSVDVYGTPYLLGKQEQQNDFAAIFGKSQEAVDAVASSLWCSLGGRRCAAEASRHAGAYHSNEGVEGIRARAPGLVAQPAPGAKEEFHAYSRDHPLVEGMSYQKMGQRCHGVKLNP